MQYLKITNYQILDFGLLKFAEHVLDTSPAVATRSQMRLVMKAVEAISEAKDGLAELTDDVAEAFRAACEAAPIPSLLTVRIGASGQPLGEPEPVPKRAFGPFYEAVENMTAERPSPKSEAEPSSHEQPAYNVTSHNQRGGITGPVVHVAVAAE